MSSEPLAILVVDDNPPMVETLADILRAKGYTVYTAQSGAAALELLQMRRVNLLLTDVIMPDINGVVLSREARRRQPDLITFLMTAYSADDLIRQGMAEGIKTVLTKPLDINLLLVLLAAADAAYVHP